ncbi:MAG TPA: activator of (R)-2-hydroxyglutaryl-CoA dehydratase [Candidatus Krumholzibacteria bacterium]|nr:activator of (R)-2-hydroxyglutaryl-CoA dehydratase [Candidatus Krumholzibacteria bacterium]
MTLDTTTMEPRAAHTAAAARPKKQHQHFKRPVERPFTRDQRPYTTVLFGGLTWSHERLIKGAWEGLGYKCDVVPTPDVKAFQLGKEYGNNGQCNPTYFTVGNLVQYLQGLEKNGLSRKEIADNYVFITAGACGPCRFGMYEAEYRLALRNSGFEDFRVILFQQSKGLSQEDVDAGLEMNLDFFLAMLNSMNMGDMLNEIGYLVRPYETTPGRINQVLDGARESLAEALKQQRHSSMGDRVEKILRRANLYNQTDYTVKFARQLTTSYYTDALGKIRDQIADIEIDRFRVKPIVKITGEFWAQTTDGDGNYNMFPFLEREGAEVIVEPIGTWIMYMIHQFKQKLRDRKGIEEGGAMPSWSKQPLRRAKVEARFRKRIARMNIAEKIFSREYTKLQHALGAGVLHELVCQYELQRMGHPYYNSRAAGGEGHLEVAKNIYYSSKGIAHMVVSLKPFGCMPSTQSDGAQAAVTEHYKDMIYLPIETSGEGEINAHSRVQMALGNARIKAKQEFAECLGKTGRTLDELKQYVEQHPEMKKALYLVPKRDDVIGKAANFALHVAERMEKEGVPRATQAAAA